MPDLNASTQIWLTVFSFISMGQKAGDVVLSDISEMGQL